MAHLPCIRTTIRWTNISTRRVEARQCGNVVKAKVTSSKLRHEKLPKAQLVQSNTNQIPRFPIGQTRLKLQTMLPHFR